MSLGAKRTSAVETRTTILVYADQVYLSDERVALSPNLFNEFAGSPHKENGDI